MRVVMIIVGLSVGAAAEPDTPRRFVLGAPLELAVFPAQVQLNVFSQHLGVGLSGDWHVDDAFALRVSGFYNYLAEFSPFYRELETKLRSESGAFRSPLLSVWGALAGVEFAPFRGQSNLGRFSIVFNAELGAGGARQQLKQPDDAGPATWGEADLRFLSRFGGGFRLELSDRLSVRLEVSDLLFTARVHNVNGCSAADLRAMDDELRNGARNAVIVSGACRVATFGIDPNTRQYVKVSAAMLDPRSNDVPGANDLVKPPFSSGPVHGVTVRLGAAVQF